LADQGISSASRHRKSVSSRSQPFPEISRSQGGADPLDQGLFQRCICKERAACARKDHTRFSILHAKPIAGSSRVAREHDNRAAAHMLFLDDDPCDAGPGEVAESLVRVFQ
jgi:hypothetical protein